MVEVLKTGFYDTIQDIGRLGYQAYGVPYSGVMDKYSATLANTILGNDIRAAVIEIVMFGPKLKFHADTIICVSGGRMNPTLNSIAIKNNNPVSVKKGDELCFGKLEYGFRVYLAISGGIFTEEKMNSKSMYSGITTKHKLDKGDLFQYPELHDDMGKPMSSVKIDKNHFDTIELEVFKGPEFDKLTEKQIDILMDSDLTVAQNSNRMAYQFQEKIPNHLSGIITSLVLPGTVQLTPSGQLMVLMRDCQTTGGYPRILQLTEASVDSLSQKIFGKKIRLKRIN